MNKSNKAVEENVKDDSIQFNINPLQEDLTKICSEICVSRKKHFTFNITASITITFHFQS